MTARPFQLLVAGRQWWTRAEPYVRSTYSSEDAALTALVDVILTDPNWGAVVLPSGNVSIMAAVRNRETGLTFVPPKHAKLFRVSEGDDAVIDDLVDLDVAEAADTLDADLAPEVVGFRAILGEAVSFGHTPAIAFRAAVLVYHARH